MDPIKDDLRRVLMDVAGVQEGFDENADFYSDLGVPSVKAMELLMTLEERYGVSVPDEEFIEATNLEKLALMVRNLKN
jgi:acyl carrier protein